MNDSKVIINKQKKLELLFSELCEILRPKLAHVSDSMEYVWVGEYGLALEFISDWCIDADPEIQLTANELLKIREIGDQIRTEHAWINLLPLLIDIEVDSIPINCANQAQRYVGEQLTDNPLRKRWLSKVSGVIGQIKSRL